MSKVSISRREFLSRTGSAAGGGWLATNWAAVFAVAQVACSRHEEEAAFENLAPDEAAALAAMADQIIPSDSTPGASDAGVIWFIDAALGGFMAGALPAIRDGLAALDTLSGGDFAGLGWDEQTEALRNIEDQPFFGAVVFMTQCGMFSMENRGGNREEAGWRLLGFEDRHAWAPPFGFYDAEALQATETDHAG